MGYGSGKLDVSHSLSSYLCLSDLNAALVAYNALISDALILSAVAFPILCRSEYLLAEESVLFGFLSSIIDGFRFQNFAVRP